MGGVDWIGRESVIEGICKPAHNVEVKGVHEPTGLSDS